jgi:hypothetical protein
MLDGTALGGVLLDDREEWRGSKREAKELKREVVEQKARGNRTLTMTFQFPLLSLKGEGEGEGMRAL